MIKYPILKPGATIGVTAPSSGVQPELHPLLEQGRRRLEQMGYSVVIGETAWTEFKAKSAPAQVRAAELNAMIRDENIGMILPPWGGELLIEILDRLDFAEWPEKWMLGYSDTSLLLLAVTLTTGIATAHGTNLIDLRGQYSDETTAMWEPALQTQAGGTVLQHSSAKYQKEWQHEHPSPCVFHLTEPTNWLPVAGSDVEIRGRVLSGCIDVIRHLIGTPYGKVQQFRDMHIPGEPILWVLENCELSTADLRRTLVQMKLAGWFDHCAGILFGRSPANRPVGGYTAEDIYRELSEELALPVVYDIDCGHVPPQITFINGAYAEIFVSDGKATVKQTFR